MRRLIALLALAILVSGCAQQAPPSAPPSPGQNPAQPSAGGQNAGAAVIVHIKNFAFDPAGVSVKQGQAVECINDDTVTHSVKAAGFQSPDIPPGGTYTHTFSEAPGDYAYSCGIHPSMHGDVTVSG